MRINKSNVFDYIEWRGDLTFHQSEFNEVDALILSILAYLDFSFIKKNEIVSFRETTDIAVQMLDFKVRGPYMIMHDVAELAEKTAKTSRFQNMEVSHYRSVFDRQREIQFAVVTFLLPDETAFLSFRGTDRTMFGWKENFNMGFIDEIPSQTEAAEYAAKTARIVKRQLRFGGHSKGGNLSIWAAAHLPTEYKEDVLAVYSNDGPGFSEDFLKSDMYKSMKDKIYSYVPESSIVGVLFRT